MISVFAGFLAGAVHVVGGVDHIVAMAPNAFKSPKLALRDGLAWGLGHSTGILFLLGLAILLKDLVHIQRMSSFAEFSVGVVLLVGGTVAIKTSFGLKIHTHLHNHGEGHNHQHFHLHFRGAKKHAQHSHASTSLGVLHGLAGASHLFAVIPALALPPIGAVAYMAAYLLGSIVAMGAMLLAMSLATLKAGRKALPGLIGFTGGLSIITGFFWVHKTSSYIL
ncbi:marine cyanobacterial conserved hypothetical protein [Prochlorococcus marinus str. MIT 9211]|uniref:Nickel transporter UreH n=1 Tax=Prochlorococcus marinus (strain MIT 9211) TaxID=93059 RepID=A9BBR2_PROM4|nr:marine cyanobacterial conserved hypothetical protein [Prochlorococcus marinus str. MIT 9211]